MPQPFPYVTAGGTSYTALDICIRLPVPEPATVRGSARLLERLIGLDSRRLGIAGWRSRGAFTTGSDQPPQFTLFGTHQSGVRAGDFMVVTEQVQRTMDEEARQLFGQRVAARTRLAESGFSRNDHIPQELRVQMRQGSFAHGKGEDVGGTSDAAIVSIQPVHPGVVDDEHAQLTVLTFEGRE